MMMVVCASAGTRTRLWGCVGISLCVTIWPLWDVIESCDIDGASDASIRNAVPNDLSPIIMRSKIAHVFTTGAKAAQLYRKLCVPLLRAHGLDGMPMTQLPSTSPANAKADLPGLVEAYGCVARSVSQAS